MDKVLILAVVVAQVIFVVCGNEEDQASAVMQKRFGMMMRPAWKPPNNFLKGDFSNKEEFKRWRSFGKRRFGPMGRVIGYKRSFEVEPELIVAPGQKRQWMMPSANMRSYVVDDKRSAIGERPTRKIEEWEQPSFKLLMP